MAPSITCPTSGTLAQNVHERLEAQAIKVLKKYEFDFYFFKMKRSTPSSFKQPPRKKQKTQSDEIAVLKRKVNKIGRAIEVKWYETSVFQPMNYATSGGVDLALYQRSLVDMGTGDSVLQRDGAKFGQKESNLVVLFLASSTTNRTYSSPMLHC